MKLNHERPGMGSVIADSLQPSTANGPLPLAEGDH
jgi:hypothetical protein